MDRVTVTVTYVLSDNSQENTDTASVKLDRFINANFNNTTDKISRIEVSAKTNNVTKAYDVKDKDGKMRFSFKDWPASTCEYNFNVYDTDGKMKTFGSYTFNVTAPDEVITGSVHMGDQGNDGSGRGSFFQSRNVVWGGGLTNANFYSAVAVTNPRLLDFAVSTLGGPAKGLFT